MAVYTFVLQFHLNNGSKKKEVDTFLSKKTGGKTK